MCRFMSAIVMANGDVIASDFTDSHEVLVEAHNLRDDGGAMAGGRAWIRVEFVPPNDKELAGNLSLWRLSVDEQSEPAWWPEIRDAVRAKLAARAERTLVRDERTCLLGGAWVLLPGSRVHRLVGGRIIMASKDANLYGANLDGANLVGANLDRANLDRANLVGATLDRANLVGANLVGANLVGANLYGANLDGATLDGANLVGANLYGANLYGANLDGANLVGANLDRANLDRANLDGASWSSAVPAPAGWRRLDSGILVRDEAQK